jgi:hypothetical protein
MADLSVHFVYAWMASFPAVKDGNLLDSQRFPLAMAVSTEHKDICFR